MMQTFIPTQVHADITGQTCGVYASADSGNLGDVHDDVDGWDGCASVSPGTCHRIGCKNTSGLFVCNGMWKQKTSCTFSRVEALSNGHVSPPDQDVEICVPYADAVNIGMVGWWTCVRSGGPLSYQVFSTNEGGYNVVGAYANCNDDVGVQPGDYGPPNDGVNGWPDVQCGAVDMPACESQREMCAVDSVVVTGEPTRESCGASTFLSASRLS